MTPPWKQQLETIASKGKHLNGTRKGNKAYRILEKPGVIPGILSLLCLSTAMILTDQWQVIVDGEVLGVVKEPKAIIRYAEDLDLYNKETYDDNVALINELQVARSYGQPTVEAADLQLVLQDRLKWGVEAAAILVEGEPVVALSDMDSAQAVIDRVKERVQSKVLNQYSTANLLSLDVAEDITVCQQLVEVEQLCNPEQAEEILLFGKQVHMRHVVSRGDTLSGIAASRGIRVSDLTKANPGVVPTRLQIGQVLALSVPEPYIHVAGEYEVSQVETISYKTDYEYDSSMWNWESKTIRAGKNGKKEVTYLIKTVNEQVVDKQVLSSKVISEPVTAIVRKGTKKAAVQGTGQFLYPTNGVLTSGYGWRWGKFHHAIDIGAPAGTSIYAADTGTVTFAGYRSGYGYLVEIDHGNGYTTRYGHCQKLLVSTGQRVTRGQRIATVGSTGNSTGPHLHFEIRYNGASRNPLNYFK